MQIEPYDNKDGYRCWLNRNEQKQLINYYGAEQSRRKLAIRILLRCGMRSDEVTRVAAKDIRELPDDGYYMIRVWEGKRGYRETPIPSSVAEDIQSAVSYGDLRRDESVVDRHEETVQRWVEEAANAIADETGNEDWRYVRAHDCRRTWCTYTYYGINSDNALDAVRQWGGWSDVDTLRRNYLGRVPDELAPKMMDSAGLD